MKKVFIATAFGILTASSVHAQNVLMMNNGGNMPFMRSNPGERAQTISINFQLSTPGNPGMSTADLTKTMAAASQTLYDIVDRECDVLAASLKGSCHLVQINIGGNINNRANGNMPSVSANANATFEIGALPASDATSPPK